MKWGPELIFSLMVAADTSLDRCRIDEPIPEKDLRLLRPWRDLHFEFTESFAQSINPGNFASQNPDSFNQLDLGPFSFYYNS